MKYNPKDFQLHGRWVERRLRNGALVPCWEPPMPRIPDKTLQCVFYLYPSMASAEAGENFGGCGFLLLVPFERAKRNHLYAVTNKHILDRGSLTLRLSTDDRGLLPVESDDRKWFRHPDGDDLAILLVDFPVAFSCTAMNILETKSVTKELIQEHDIGVGEEAFSVGRFVNHDGKQMHSPVVRFGNISQMPGEPIKQDDGFMQESYLVEGRSVGGYSGAPVFMFIPPWAIRPNKNQVTSAQFGPWFLGVNWGHLVDWKPVCDSVGRPMQHGQQVQQNTGMMGVVPAWKLIEMINHPKMKAERAIEEDRILGKGPPIAVSDSVASVPHTGALAPSNHPAEP